MAPADPDKFGIGDQLPARGLTMPSTVVLSNNDPWLGLAAGQRWAARWGSRIVNLGGAGHINVGAGFGPLPFARRWVMAMEQRLARESRPERASIHEWTFAV